jgi:hypothetical protein
MDRHHRGRGFPRDCPFSPRPPGIHSGLWPSEEDETLALLKDVRVQNPRTVATPCRKRDRSPCLDMTPRPPPRAPQPILPAGLADQSAAGAPPLWARAIVDRLDKLEKVQTPTLRTATRDTHPRRVQPVVDVDDPFDDIDDDNDDLEDYEGLYHNATTASPYLMAPRSHLRQTATKKPFTHTNGETTVTTGGPRHGPPSIAAWRRRMVSIDETCFSHTPLSNSS